MPAFATSLVLIPLVARTGGGHVVAELVFSRPVTDDDVARISELGGRIVYRFDRVNELVVAIESSKVGLLKRSQRC